MIQVLHNQNLLDITLQNYGNIKAIFDKAIINNISITSELIIKQNLLKTKTVYYDTEVVDYFKNKSINIATGKYNISETMIQEGIDYWLINNNFMVQ